MSGELAAEPSVSAAPPSPAGAAPRASAVAPDRAALGLAGQPDQEVRSATSDAAAFAGATYGAQALLFVAGFVQKGIIGPVGTGYWSLMQTFWVFLTIAPLGAMQGSTRQIPARRGRGDYVGAAAVAATGNSFSLA